MEYSKKLTSLSWKVAITLTMLAVLLPIFGVSIEGVMAALPYSWMEVTAVQGLYIWKAKNENRSKYAMKYVDKYAKQHDVETGLRVAEIVLKD